MAAENESIFQKNQLVSHAMSVAVLIKTLLNMLDSFLESLINVQPVLGLTLF